MSALNAVRALIIILVLILSGCSKEEEATSSTEAQIAALRAARLTRQTGSTPEAGSGGPAAGQSGDEQAFSSSRAGEEDSLIQIEGISFDPSVPVSEDSIRAVVALASSTDGGERPKLRYRWKINGKQVQESGSDTLSELAKRDDYVEVEVEAESAAAKGKPVTRYVVVANAPPVLRVAEQNMASDGKYEARLEALDPEQDKVTFALKSGPPGLTVDSGTGRVVWTPSPDVQGTFSIEILARDAMGAESLIGYQIKIRRDPQGKAS